VAALIELCPTGALHGRDGHLDVDLGRCVHCYRCAYGVDHPAEWKADYEWGGLAGGDAAGPARRAAPEPARRGGGRAIEGAFGRSLHILVVDAGDCGACLHEVQQLNNPYYNMHRLGFFVTPTPRHADVLLVVGPVADQMRVPLLKAWEAMPTPKRVMAVGSCALSGGVFGPSFASSGGVADVLAVDVEVPGQPPPPLAILHGLLVAVGRADTFTGATDTEAAVASSPRGRGAPRR
jgi:Ni,Fe-hydrogenase III small subunit